MFTGVNSTYNVTFPSSKACPAFSCWAEPGVAGSQWGRTVCIGLHNGESQNVQSKFCVRKVRYIFTKLCYATALVDPLFWNDFYPVAFETPEIPQKIKLPASDFWFLTDSSSTMYNMLKWAL